MSLKSILVAVGRPVVKAGWPAVEALAVARAKSRRPESVQVTEYAEWNEELDGCLDQLPEPPHCSREDYRQLCLPTEYPKRHFAVSEGGELIALLSVRRRQTYWEPVSYQALPGFIAPARDDESLARALKSVGIEIAISAGMGEGVKVLNPDVVYDYEVNVADLTQDYEAHWKKNKRRHLNSIRKARRKCADFGIVVDDAADIEWGLRAWRDMWADDAEGEICAFPDRQRFWRALRVRTDFKPDWFRIHTLSIRDEQKTIACVIFVRRGDTLYWQCTSRDLDYNKFGVGTYALDCALSWAREQGIHYADLSGGGGFKSDWAPSGGKRYGAIFRPAAIRFLRKFNS